MKKTVLKFGLIAAAILVVLMFATLPIVDKIGFDKGVIVGYTTMVLAFMMVFFGIRSYRETVGGGRISFGRAFAVGILITLFACVFYVIAWEIVYFKFMPDFADKYAGYIIEQARAGGATQQVIDAKLAEMKAMKAILDNPIYNALVSFTEPFPVGLLITLVSAAILRKKADSKQQAAISQTA